MEMAMLITQSTIVGQLRERVNTASSTPARRPWLLLPRARRQVDEHQPLPAVREWVSSGRVSPHKNAR